MLIMKLIILSGKSNCGKTASLNLLHNMLLNTNTVVEESKISVGNPSQQDYVYLMKCSCTNKKIVISTWGDYPYLLNDYCSKYIDYDTVICACNMNFMRNTVHKPFEDAMRFDNLTTVILKTPESDINKYATSNNACATYLLNLIKHFGII